MKFAILLALAVLVGSCKAVTLASLFAPGASITVGNAHFQNWIQNVNSITGGDSFGRTVVDITRISVTGDNTNPLNPSLVFTPSPNTELSVKQSGGTPATLSLAFQFDVSSTNPALAFDGVGLIATFTRSPDTMSDNILGEVHEIIYTSSNLLTVLGTVDRHLQDDDGVVVGPGM